MIENFLVQKGVIDALKDNVALTAYLSGTGQIKEANWQGQDFIYPSIRVDMQNEAPEGTGTDHVRFSRVLWSIKVYSEKASSYEANKILALVINALFNKQMYGNDENNSPNFVLVRIDLVNVDSAFRLSERLWMATATFEGNGHILNPTI